MAAVDGIIEHQVLCSSMLSFGVDQSCGVVLQAYVEGGETVVCTSCHDGCCVALVHDAHGAAVWCLKCASTISIGATLTVHVTRRMGELEDLARQFEAALAAEPMPGAPSWSS